MIGRGLVVILLRLLIFYQYCWRLGHRARPVKDVPEAFLAVMGRDGRTYLGGQFIVRTLFTLSVAVNVAVLCVTVSHDFPAIDVSVLAIHVALNRLTFGISVLCDDRADTTIYGNIAVFCY